MTTLDLINLNTKSHFVNELKLYVKGNYVLYLRWLPLVKKECTHYITVREEDSMYSREIGFKVLN